MDTLACDFAPRMPISAAATASSVASSPVDVAELRDLGPAERWIEPLCHQDHTSSVTKGTNGASSRSWTCSARARVAFAESVESPPVSSYARSLTSSR